MRIVTLEEHVSFPELTQTIAPEDIINKAAVDLKPMDDVVSKLADVTNERLKLMDQSGVSMQVISVTGLGADRLKPEVAVNVASKYNDLIATKIANHKNRFAAFAHLPMTDPAAAADELERAVKEHGFKGALINGMTNNEFLDDEKYAPIFERAESLDVPIYLHPGIPPKAVVDAYYSNLPKEAGNRLSVAGWGWHSETAIHTLRLIVAGTLDKYPGLKLIIGHMGEMLPMMAARCDNMFKPNTTGLNQRSISQTLRDQVYITTSGIFTLPPLMAAIAVFGIDRVLFSVDYPYSPNEIGTKYLQSLPLAPADVEKIAHGNADRLLKLE